MTTRADEPRGGQSSGLHAASSYSTLVKISSGWGAGVVGHLVEHCEDLPGEVALQAADGLLLGLALLEPPCHVVTGPLVPAQPHDHKSRSRPLSAAGRGCPRQRPAAHQRCQGRRRTGRPARERPWRPAGRVGQRGFGADRLGSRRPRLLQSLLIELDEDEPGQVANSSAYDLAGLIRRTRSPAVGGWRRRHSRSEAARRHERPAWLPLSQ